jgi:uncharacterized protein YigE (DUF2233 family)
LTALKILIKYFLLFVITLQLFSFRTAEEPVISYIADPKTQEIQLFWKTDKKEILGSIQNLKTFVEGKKQTLLFAMNGGMYTEDQKPLGLFIQAGKEIKQINTANAENANFYLKPNGIFYLNKDNVAAVCKTEDFKDDGTQKYATQSGPMLLIDGAIHSSFKKSSSNLNIRNGVGILPDGKVLFAISKTEINFYDFAMYFRKQGCKNALYLDGFVSRMYCPEKGIKDLDGNFGVMIAVLKK